MSTPGPWQVAQYSTGAEIQWWPKDYKGDEYGKPLTVASVASNRHDDPQGNANARLIAAAPELLAALKLFTNGHIDVSETAVILGYEQTRDALNKARAAIAKAEGKT